MNTYTNHRDRNVSRMTHNKAVLDDVANENPELRQSKASLCPVRSTTASKAPVILLSERMGAGLRRAPISTSPPRVANAEIFARVAKTLFVSLNSSHSILEFDGVADLFIVHVVGAAVADIATVSSLIQTMRTGSAADLPMFMRLELDKIERRDHSRTFEKGCPLFVCESTCCLRSC